MSSNNREQFYTSLKNKLDEQEEWPTLYMFKFIVPTEENRIRQVEGLFRKDASVSMKESSNGTYTSVTATLQMGSPTAVIEVYKKAEKIEGIVAL